MKRHDYGSGQGDIHSAFERVKSGRAVIRLGGAGLATLDVFDAYLELIILTKDPIKLKMFCTYLSNNSKVEIGPNDSQVLASSKSSFLSVITFLNVYTRMSKMIEAFQLAQNFKIMPPRWLIGYQALRELSQ